VYLNSLIVAVTNEYDPEYGIEQRGPILRLELSQIRALVDQAAEEGCGLIVFTGGEPFLLGKALEEAVLYAAFRVPKVRVVTDCYWAATAEDALRNVGLMYQAGLSELDFRFSEWNQKQVYQQRIKWATLAAEKAGLTILSHCFMDRSRKGIRIYHMKQYSSAARDSYSGAWETGALPDQFYPLDSLPYGYRQGDRPADDCLPFLQQSERNNCPYILNSVTAHPDGKLTACGGQACGVASELNLGDWFTTPLLELVRRGERNPLLQWIRMGGPGGLREYIEEREPDIRFEESYANACHLCGDLLTRSETRQFLRENASRAAEEAITLRIQQLETIKGALPGAYAGVRETA
jgi:hypothetical protein